MITLKTLPDTTAQEVFDQAAEHLLRQNAKSVEFEVEKNAGCTARCMYRGINGKKCVAGCFISDEEYNPNWEACAWEDLVNADSVPSNHEELISRLQYLHDSKQVDRWKEELKVIAQAFNLETIILEKF